MIWAGHVARMGEERGVYRVLVGKPEGSRPLGRPRRRWVDIRMDLQEVGCGYMDWIGLAQDWDRWRTLVSAVMNLKKKRLKRAALCRKLASQIFFYNFKMAHTAKVHIYACRQILTAIMYSKPKITQNKAKLVNKVNCYSLLLQALNLL